MKKFLLTTALFLLPSVALADVTNLTSLISQLQTVINALIPLLFSIALIGFIVGVIRYIWSAGNPSKIKEARSFIVFSIIGIAVMLSVWSLALFVKNSFFPDAPAGINFSGNTINNNNITTYADCSLESTAPGAACNGSGGTCQEGACQ